MKIAEKGMRDADEVGAASYDFLMYSGYVTLGYFWLKMAITAQDILDGNRQSTHCNQPEFLEVKINNARFYFDRILPRALSHKVIMLSGKDSLMATKDTQFG